MSRVVSGVLVAAIATFAFGAVHLAGASGNNSHWILARGGDASVPSVPRDVSIVNRATKSDRVAAPVQDRGMTISFKSPSLPGTSFMVRVPAENVARRAPANNVAPPAAIRKTTACEPSVSVLTAVANQLQPSRCLV